MVESGFPALDAPTWFAVVARADTPAPILERLRQEFNAVIASEDYAQRAGRPAVMRSCAVPPEASERFLAGERKLWSDAVKVAGVSLD